MSKTQWYIGIPNGVVLCIDKVEQHRWQGEFYHAYSETGVRVESIEELIFGLEEFYNGLNFPHPGTNLRSFNPEKTDIIQYKERKRVMQDDKLLSKHGDLGTFIIRVQHRQNSSWQGRLTWMDQDKTVYFRSIWEMMQLIESALDKVMEPEMRAQPPVWPVDEKK